LDDDGGDGGDEKCEGADGDDDEDPPPSLLSLLLFAAGDGEGGGGHAERGGLDAVGVGGGSRSYSSVGGGGRSSSRYGGGGADAGDGGGGRGMMDGGDDVHTVGHVSHLLMQSTFVSGPPTAAAWPWSPATTTEIIHEATINDTDTSTAIRFSAIAAARTQSSHALACAGEIPACLWLPTMWLFIKQGGKKALQKCAKLEVQAPAESLWAELMGVPCRENAGCKGRCLQINLEEWAAYLSCAWSC
jgi:hypothetical protein